MNRRAKAVLVMAAVLILSLPMSVLALPEEEVVDSDIEKEFKLQLSNSDFSSWEQIYYDSGCYELFDGMTLVQAIEKIAVSGIAPNGDNIIESAVEKVKSGLRDSLGIILLIVVTALLGSLAATAINGRKNGGTAEIIELICNESVALTLVYVLAKNAATARNAVQSLCSINELVTPVMSVLLTAAGSAEAGSIMSPAMLFLGTGVIEVICNVIIPIVISGGIVAIADGITARTKLTGLYRLSKDAAKWILGLIFTVYIGVLSVSGVSMGTINGFSLRTARFALDKLIPVVGGMISGTVETALGCTMVIKNSAGIASILIVLYSVTKPIIEIVAAVFTLRIAAACCEPVANDRIPRMLLAVADVMTYLFAAIVGTAVMFIISVGIIIGTGRVYI